jgi:hypothetical protein
MDEVQTAAIGRQATLQDAETVLRARHRLAVIIRSTYLGAVIMLGALGVAMFSGPLHTASSPEVIAVLSMTFGFVSAMAALCAVLVVPAILPLEVSPSARAAAQRSGTSVSEIVAGKLFSRTIVAGGMTEIAGLLGFVLLVSGADVTIYATFLVLSLASSAMTWPRWSVWEQAAMDAAAFLPSVG